jgi:hypothetical protein
MENEVVIVKVEVIDAVLRAYGIYRYESLSRARQGEADGYYKIIEEVQAGGDSGNK